DVADERADALIEVVAGAEESQGDDDRPGPEPQPPQSQPPETEDDDLFDDPVLRGREQQDGNRPPMIAEVGRLDLGRDPQCPAARVHPEGADADDEEDEDTVAEVAPSVPVDSESGRQRLRRPVSAEQVDREGDGNEGEADVEKLVDEVETRPG